MQFNTVNHTFFNNYISNLSHYAQFYINQFSKELVAKTLIESNTKYVINFKKKKQSSFKLIYNQFIKKLKAL